MGTDSPDRSGIAEPLVTDADLAALADAAQPTRAYCYPSLSGPCR
jgi:hypothetical protein